ncbi:hypothetical protein ACFLUC_01005 [Chloroflexota bacterium]
MDQLDSITQAYTQAPWRRQLQLIGLFSMVLVFIALIAGIYLNVSSRAATAGREIQTKQREIEVLEREIEDLQTQLALLLSSGEMEQRAKELGFELLNVDETVYIVVTNYSDRQPAVIAPYSNRAVVSAPVVPAEYYETIFQWLKIQIAEHSIPLPKVLP